MIKLLLERIKTISFLNVEFSFWRVNVDCIIDALVAGLAANKRAVAVVFVSDFDLRIATVTLARSYV